MSLNTNLILLVFRLRKNKIRISGIMWMLQMYHLQIPKYMLVNVVWKHQKIFKFVGLLDSDITMKVMNVFDFTMIICRCFLCQKKKFKVN